MPFPVEDQQKASMHTAITFVVAKPELFCPDFMDWLRSNWPVWLAFKRRADAIRFSGREHYSARRIIEELRHDTTISDHDPDFKINGNYVPSLARLWLCYNPDAKEFFHFRGTPGVVTE